MIKEDIINEYKSYKLLYLEQEIFGKKFYNEEFVNFLFNSIIEKDKQILREI